MPKLMIPAAVLALAGCANTSVLTVNEAQRMSAVDLCIGVATYKPHNAATAYNEVQRRGINCQDHQQAMQMVMQQRAAASAYMLQGGPFAPALQPYQMQVPRQTNCRTVRIGDSLQTSCQ